MAVSLSPWIAASFIAITVPYFWWLIVKVIPEAGKIYGDQRDYI